MARNTCCAEAGLLLHGEGGLLWRAGCPATEVAAFVPSIPTEVAAMSCCDKDADCCTTKPGLLLGKGQLGSRGRGTLL